jgi:hypothetical protein
VVDKSGGPVSLAQITVTNLKNHQVVATGKTSEAGRVSLPLIGGEYTILIEKAGLQSQSLSASITQREMKPVTVKMQNAHFFMGLVMIAPAPKNLPKNN